MNARLLVVGGCLLGETMFLAIGHAETVVSAYGGTASTHASSVTLEEPGVTLTFRDVSWTTEPFVSPIYYGIRISHWLESGPGWGIALDFTHSKMYAGLEDSLSVTGSRDGEPVQGQERLGDTFSGLSFSHGHNTLVLSGLYRLMFSRVQLQVGLGLGVAVPHIEVRTEGQATDEYQLSGSAFQGLLGGGVALAGPLAALVEYKLVYARIDGSLKNGGTIGTEPWTHQFVFGLAVTVLR